MLTWEIIRSAERGDAAAIQEWFSSGTRDPDERDGVGRTLLYICAEHGDCEAMCILLENGADVESRENKCGITPLHRATLGGHVDAAALLLESGAFIDTISREGYTALILAAYYGQSFMIDFLLRHNASIDIRDCDGTAEDNARKEGHLRHAALLRDVRLAGGSWDAYVRFPRKRVLALRVLCEQGRAATDDSLLRRLFPAAAPPAAGVKGAREEYVAAKGGRLPRGIFWHIFEYWRCDLRESVREIHT